MKITIITVSYNSVATIEKTIQSVIAQKFHDVEYIIVDGGSTDHTAEIIRKYKDNISVYISEPDQGIYDAMNKGLGRATGEIVAFLNSDDWYLPNILDRVESYFKSYPVDIVSGGIYVCSNGECMKAPHSKLTGENIFFDIVCPHPAMFVKRELFERLGKFDTSYEIAADTKWVMNAYAGGSRILCVDEYFTCFRDGGVSSVRKLDAWKEQYRAALTCAQENQLTELEQKVNAYYQEKIREAETEKKVETALAEKAGQVKSMFESSAGYYIWGTGVRGERCREIFEKLELRITAFIDSYRTRERVGKYQVIMPEEIDRENYVCITPKNYEKEIKGQLRNMGIDENQVFTYTDMLETIGTLCADDYK